MSTMDYSALSDDGTPGNLPAMKRRDRRRATGARRVGMIVRFAGFAALIWPIAGLVRLALAENPLEVRSATLVLVYALLALAVLGASLAVSFVRRRLNGVKAGSPALARFAESNGLRYEAATESPYLPGRIFTGRHRTGLVVTDRMLDPHGRFELANYGFDSSGRRAGIPWGVGYLAIRLDRRVPHLFFDGRPISERDASPFAAGIAGAQEIALEGDFSSHFTLYAPDGYGTDARYLLTPDLMALLVDEAGGYSLEIVDDWLFVYSWHPFTADEELFRRLFAIVGIVGAKVRRQTGRYQDDRAEPALTVHDRGRRLGRGGRSAAGDTWSTILQLLALIGILVVAVGPGLPF